MVRVRKGVVVVTFEGSVWLPECLEALKGVDVDVFTNTKEKNGFEGGGLVYGASKYDEFWLIPDTVIVKDTKKLLECLDDTGTSYSAGPWFISCIGKFRTDVLNHIGLPEVPTNKLEAIMIEIQYLRKKYTKAEPEYVVLDENFKDGDRFEEKHGRTNMILESDTFKKYKGTWDT